MISYSNLRKHEKFLKEKVFFVKSKWPQFDILFKDINKISKSINKNMSVLSIERGGLYGNISLLAPFFHKGKYYSIDCSGYNIKKRKAYNKHLVHHKEIIKTRINEHQFYQKLKAKKNHYDIIIIPNLIHHIAEHDNLIKKCRSFLKKNGKIYIFDAILRELHQEPDDYLRFTPYGLKKKLQKHKFKILETKKSGGPFSAIAYCWDQALQYLPKNLRIKKTNWFYKKEFKKLMSYDKKFKKNLIRKHTSFPLSYSILAKK